MNDFELDTTGAGSSPQGGAIVRSQAPRPSSLFRGSFNPLVWLRRHPVPIAAFFRHSLVLTYALPEAVLKPLLPPGLMLDTHKGFGFVAIALVQTENLRPVLCPPAFGQNFFLAGYRIFVRFKTNSGRTLRGLRILRSYTDRRLMVFVGNRLTHYGYQLAKIDVQETSDRLEFAMKTPGGQADLQVRADLGEQPTALPAGSPFDDFRTARLFAGPLPYTFDYEESTHSIICIEGVRQDWRPQPVSVKVETNSFFDNSQFEGTSPVLANTFRVENVHYRWRRGIREPLQPFVP